MTYEGKTITEIWTKSEVDYLTAAILAGKSYGQAAELLNKKYKTNRSRNAIAGKVHRLKYSHYAPYSEKKHRYAGLMG